jgi:hypothetical protein
MVEILTGANVALKLIQARIILILALLLTAGAFAWAMWLQTVLGAIIAATWGLMIFLPVLFAGRGGDYATAERAERAEDGTQAGA